MANNLNKELRGRLSGRDTLLVPGAPNALAAKITEDIGFEAVYVTGAGIANTYLGVPDNGFVTLTELAEHVAAIRDAVVLPLIADADTGFDNPLNVTRTVKMLERSGANAIQIEDQITPKRCGHFNDKRVIGRDEMVQKIHAAADARQNDDLIINAGTDARAALGFEEAVERAAVYLEAGAGRDLRRSPSKRGGGRGDTPEASGSAGNQHGAGRTDASARLGGARGLRNRALRQRRVTGSYLRHAKRD